MATHGTNPYNSGMVHDGHSVLSFSILKHESIRSGGRHLEARGALLRGGTIVDATLIAVSPSTRNEAGKRDPQMHSSKKGNQWYFGMKAHVGVDASSGLVHIAGVTSGNVHDAKLMDRLIRDDDTAVYGDKGYANAAKKRAAEAAGVLWAVKEKAKLGGRLTPRQRAHNLALLWQILSGTGFPNQFFNNSWVVGFLEGPTMVSRTFDWKEELGRWLKPFLGRLGHKARRQMCPLYVSGLIGPGDRKSIQPMAERLALGEYDQLHHFIAAGVWDAAPVETELLVQADKLVGGSDAVLVIDDTAIPKKGAHSVGVAPQYASALGKTANCQTLVSLTLARCEVPVMLVLRLFLPESWTSNRARLERAGVPTEYRTARTKPEMALAEIDRVIAAGVRFGYVLADAGYGISAPFRQGLTARELAWAVGIPRHLKVYPADVRMIWPIAGRSHPRRRHVPDILSIAAEDMLADAPWQNISWRTGTKGKLKARFAGSAARESRACVSCREVSVRLSQGSLSRHRQEQGPGVLAVGARQSVSRPQDTCVRLTTPGHPFPPVALAGGFDKKTFA